MEYTLNRVRLGGKVVRIKNKEQARIAAEFSPKPIDVDYYWAMYGETGNSLCFDLNEGIACAEFFFLADKKKALNFETVFKQVK